MRRREASGDRREVERETCGTRGGASPVRRGARAGVLLLLAIAGQTAEAADVPSAYDAIIAPIFRARCVECHGEQKQKAKLALHTWDGLVKGSDAGPVFVAGKPTESPLIERVKLPASDEDHMPPSDRPQPAPEEIALLTHWIERGASRTATLAELQLPAPLAQAAAQLPAKLATIASATAANTAEPLWEFDAAAVAKARAPLAAKVAELQRHFPGALSYESRTSAALIFTAAGFGRDFDDAALARLAPLREQLVSLDVSGTGISDQSAEVVGGFSALRVFRASATRAGDAMAQRLASLPVLESVSLSGTAVTEACVGAFSKMRTLHALRMAGTAAEDAAQAANLPVVPSAADLLPPVSAEPAEKSR